MASIATPGCERSSATAIKSSEPASVSIRIGPCALRATAAQKSAASARNGITPATIARSGRLRSQGFRINHDTCLGVAKYLVKNLVGRKLALQKIDTFGGDDEAAAIVLQNVAFGAEIPQGKQQPLEREGHDILHVEERESGIVRIRAAFTVEQT